MIENRHFVNRHFVCWEHVEPDVLNDQKLYEIHKAKGIERLNKLGHDDGYTITATSLEVVELGFVQNWDGERDQWVDMKMVDFMNLTPTRKMLKLIFTGFGEKDI